MLVRLSLTLLLSLLLASAIHAAPATAVCYVCREAEEPVAATVRHGDHEHSFCSAACAAAFRKSPEKYHPLEPVKQVAALAKPMCPAPGGSSAPSCPV